MIWNALSNERLPGILRKLSIVTSVLFGILAIGIATTSFGYMLSGSAAAAEKVGMDRQITEMKATIERSKRLQVKVPHTRNIEQTQAIIDETAAAHNCRLIEFQAAGDSQIFTPKFNPSSQVKGWIQTSVQTQIEGSMSGVFEVLKAIASGSDPIEFDSFELNTGRDSSTEVIAKITFRILSMETKR